MAPPPRGLRGKGRHPCKGPELIRSVHFSQPETLQANLIMPEPCPFLNRSFPLCSIIRPTETEGIAMGGANALTSDGLFISQTSEFFQLLKDLASDADQARRETNE